MRSRMALSPGRMAMRTIFFIIKGNHTDPFGNAFPKLKMTGKQSWTPKAQSYVMWKHFVRKQYIDALRLEDPAEAKIAERNTMITGKPIVLDKNQSARMDLVISWKNDAHGDPENIFGSIADALFHNDKNLYGSFSPLEGRTAGEVWCTITVSAPAPK